MSSTTPQPRPGPSDSAVSPVIAVILMVAITVVLAATVYVWVSGFTETGNQAPSANFKYIGCDPDTGSQTDTGENDGWNNVTVRLTSGGPLQLGDTRVILYNQTDNTQMAQTDPMVSDGGQWATGTQKTITDKGMASGNANLDADWDSVMNPNLEDGTQYKLDFVHKPTQSTYSSIPFTC